MTPLSLARLYLSKRTRAPVALVHFVTNRCNARCSHCFIDRGLAMYSGEELGLAEIQTVADSLRDSVYHVSLTGGEPTLREDLADIAIAYADRARVGSMLIASNGSQPDTLSQAITHILDASPTLDLIVSLSIDEIGPAHDATRGMPGLFAKALSTYERLLPLKGRGLSLNANLTLTRHNQGRAVEILSEAMETMPEASLSLTAVRGRTADPNAKALAAQRYGEASHFLHNCCDEGKLPPVYENFAVGRRLLNARKWVLRGEIERLLAGHQPRGNCYAGKLTGVLMANGSVYPCELLSRPMGNVRDFDLDFPSLWQSEGAETVRRSIDEAKCACTYECAWGANVLFGLRYLPHLVAALFR